MLEAFVKVVPKVDSGDLSRMENSLNARFKRVAKGFGKGLLSAFKIASIGAIGTELINKVLNPFKEVSEEIDKTLSEAQTIKVDATQFNTSAGNLFKLVEVSKTLGVDKETLFTLMSHYQTAVAKARLAPDDAESAPVKNFTKYKDDAEGFFHFLQNVSKLKPNDKTIVENSLFGARLQLSAAKLLTPDLIKNYLALGLDKRSSKSFTQAIGQNAAHGDQLAVGRGKVDINDLFAQTNYITDSTVRTQVEAYKRERERLYEREARFKQMAKIAKTAEKLDAFLEQGAADIVDAVSVYLPDMGLILDRFEKTWLPRIMNFLKGGGF